MNGVVINPDIATAVETTAIKTLLAHSPLPRLEAHWLLQHVLHVPRAWLIAHDTDALAPAQVRDFLHLQDRRMAGEPVAYLLGEREFMGHTFHVNPATLIPRPETELLVEQALTVLSDNDISALRVLDLGTGSGAVAVSIALARPDAVMIATDASSAALATATRNAQRLGAHVSFHQGDWYTALPANTRIFDVIVSNPPYIAKDDPHLTQGDLRFEPAQALAGGTDGLDALRTIIVHAPAWLKPGGQIWLEHGYNQAQAVQKLLQQAGFRQIRSLPDLAGILRVTGGQMSGETDGKTTNNV